MMNALRNKVQLIGRLGQDPKIITFDEGKTKANFSVATNESYRDNSGDKVDKTQWHEIVAWGPLSEIMGQYLKKGSEVAIEGRLQYRTYDDKEGNTRYVTEIIAKDLLMLDKKPADA
jgi:single-strand DNA-binding protein